MARIALPRIPDSGHELEDYVAGLFQAAGYFVERNVRRREETEVLELDAVAWSYDGPVPLPVLAEAKGGRWGYPDLFKVAGWMAYLGIKRGGVFVKEGPGTSSRDVARIHRTVAPLGVSLVNLGDFRDPAARLADAGFRIIVPGVPGPGGAPRRRLDPLLVDVWRYAYRVERALLAKVREERRAAADRRGPQELLLYHDLVNDHAFFIKDPAERLRRLYAAYRSHPKLSAALAAELAGAPYPPPGARHVPRDNRLLAEAIYEGQHALVQGAFYVEHRARLSILKAAVDLIALLSASARGQGSPSPSPLSMSALPATFRAGLRRLRERPSFRRYALLWQVFLWGFGGFTIEGRENEELGWLSAQTGVPRAEIPAALAAFDELFPLPNGSWIIPVRGTPLRVVRMVPPAFRGIGAVQRLRRYGLANYDPLGLGAVARRQLIMWHNAFVQLVAGSGQAPGAGDAAAAPAAQPAVTAAPPAAPAAKAR